MSALPESQRRFYRGWVTIVGLIVVALLGLIDLVTGPQVSFTVIYLGPVALVAWFGGRPEGIVLAIIAAVIRFLADYLVLTDQDDALPTYLHGTTALVIFPIVVYLLTALKESREQLEKRVEERTADLRDEIAERKRAEASLHELAAQLSAAEDIERRRIASDMHDSIGQSLSVLKLHLETQAQHLTDGPGAQMAESLQLLDDIIRQTRTLTFNLYPTMLDDLGLVPTLSWYGERLSSQTGVQVTISEVGEPKTLPAVLANYLFRACKELLSNAIKHGRARELVVAVHWQDGGVRIVVDDDGCGFDRDRTLGPDGRQGLGLAGIRERISSFGGRLLVESEPGQGTRVIMEVGTGSDLSRAKARSAGA